MPSNLSYFKFIHFLLPFIDSPDDDDDDFDDRAK